MKKNYLIIAVFAILLCSCNRSVERKNKEWQERIEENGKKLREDMHKAENGDHNLSDILPDVNPVVIEEDEEGGE